jgi:hypothetical protein
VRAYHATTLHGRRIIAYAAGSSLRQQGGDVADNLIKTFWAENAGASASAAPTATASRRRPTSART